MAKKITAPLTAETVKDLRAGDSVLISGTIYTGRDAAHKRLTDSLKAGEKLPFDLAGAFTTGLIRSRPVVYLLAMGAGEFLGHHDVAERVEGLGIAEIPVASHGKMVTVAP